MREFALYEATALSISLDAEDLTTRQPTVNLILCIELLDSLIELFSLVGPGPLLVVLPLLHPIHDAVETLQQLFLAGVSLLTGAKFNWTVHFFDRGYNYLHR